MVNLAKQLNNNADMINFAQIFIQQPRNTPTSQSVPYCQKAPANAELNGFFQCQFQGADATTFVGGTKVGGAGTIPFGLNAPLNPAGSCPAHTSGPIADGTQLTDQVSSPGTPSTSSGSANPPPASLPPATPSSANTDTAPSSASCAATAATVTVTVTADTNAAPVASATAVTSGSAQTVAPASASSPAASGDFHLQNGKDAQALNANFETLSASSSCNNGDQACVSGGFAQCVNGNFAITQCAGGTTCAALPLVNKAGTSITCTTQADAIARIAATGATGGIDGSGNGAAVSTPNATPSAASAAVSVAPAASTAAPAASSASDFKLQNGKDAQSLNAQFSTLSTSSSCNDGDEACVDGGFAQCVGGKFAITQCAGGTTCAALPLVNKAGTSIACTTQADAVARIAATGATGGINGSTA